MSELALFGGSKAKRKPFPDWPQYDDGERNDAGLGRNRRLGDLGAHRRPTGFDAGDFELVG